MRRIILSDGVGMSDRPLASRGVITAGGPPSLSCGVLLGDDDGTGDEGETADGVIAGSLYAPADRALPRGCVIASMPHVAAAAPSAPA